MRPRSGARAPRCRSRRGTRRPSASSLARSSSAFSMMPLCTTAMRPAVSVCGWALTSLGSPWVAQRVWPMPSVALKRVGVERPAGRRPGPALRTFRPAAGAPRRRRPSRSRGTPAAAAPRAGRRRVTLADVSDDSAHLAAVLLCLAVDDAPELALGELWVRDPAALQLGRDPGEMRRSPCRALQLAVAPPDELLDGLGEVGEHVLDDPGGRSPPAAQWTPLTLRTRSVGNWSLTGRPRRRLAPY